MSKHDEPPLLLKLKPSERLQRMLILAHGLALAACAISYLPLVFKLALAAVIGLHLYFEVKHLTSGQYKIKYSEASAWEVADENDFESVQILPSTVVTTFAVFLHIKRENADKQTILVLSDALSKDAYRQLIVKLKTTATK
jgi:Membrane-bound toxin component of toxin-antitoxin system